MGGANLQCKMYFLFTSSTSRMGRDLFWWWQSRVRVATSHRETNIDLPIHNLVV